MTDAMKVLLQYAEEHLVHALMLQTPEYLNIRSRVAEGEETFRALLAEETTERFEKLMTDRQDLDYIYEQALFRAGFLIGMELSK